MPSRSRNRQPSRLLAAGLACALLLLFAAAEARADAAQVTVVSPGGAEQTLALEALAGGEDVRDRAYVVRDGSAETTQTITGFSLAQLVEAAGADPYGFSYLEVQRPGGGAVQLSRHQALDSGAFPDGPPVLYADAAGTGFLRPSAGVEDANAADSFLAPQGIRVVLSKGAPLRVKVLASTVKTRPGEEVGFEAVVERSGSGERLSFSWSFDDGGSAAGQRVTHAFKRRGSYDVVLGVTSPGNPAGASAVVRVQVGAPIAGPERRGGGRNEREDAPDHGAAAGPASGNGSGNGPGAGVPAAPAPDDIAAKDRPSAAAGNEVRQAARPRGTLVRGALLSAEAASSPQPEEAQAQAREGSLDGGDSGGGLPAGAWGGLATLGLLGLGGLLEARGVGGLLPGRRQEGTA